MAKQTRIITDILLSAAAGVVGGITLYASAAYVTPKIKPAVVTPKDRDKVTITAKTQGSTNCSKRTLIDVPTTMRTSKSASASVAVDLGPSKTTYSGHERENMLIQVCVASFRAVALRSTKAIEIAPSIARAVDYGGGGVTWDIEGNKLGVFTLVFDGLGLDANQALQVTGPQGKNKYEVRPDGSLAADIEVLSPNGISAESKEKLDLVKNYSFGAGGLVGPGVVFLWRRWRNKREQAGWRNAETGQDRIAKKVGR